MNMYLLVSLIHNAARRQFKVMSVRTITYSDFVMALGQDYLSNFP